MVRHWLCYYLFHALHDFWDLKLWSICEEINEAAVRYITQLTSLGISFSAQSWQAPKLELFLFNYANQRNLIHRRASIFVWCVSWWIPGMPSTPAHIVSAQEVFVEWINKCAPWFAGHYKARHMLWYCSQKQWLERRWSFHYSWWDVCWLSAMTHHTTCRLWPLTCPCAAAYWDSRASKLSRAEQAASSWYTQPPHVFPLLQLPSTVFVCLFVCLFVLISALSLNAVQVVWLQRLSQSPVQHISSSLLNSVYSHLSLRQFLQAVAMETFSHELWLETISKPQLVTVERMRNDWIHSFIHSFIRSFIRSFTCVSDFNGTRTLNCVYLH
jgi:hypothetical protein